MNSLSIRPVLQAICWLLAIATLTVEAQDETSLDYRTWRDATGRYKIEAGLVDFRDGKAYLKRTDGKTISVSASKLSRTDQIYIRESLKRRRADAMESTGVGNETASSADWPGWRGANRDGKSPDTGLLKQWPAGGPPLLWKVDVLGKGFATVAVVNGTVYTAGDVNGQHTVFAFDMEGNLRWQVQHDQAWTANYHGSRSTPVIDNGKLYIVSGHGLVGCYDATNGRKIWTQHHRQFGGNPPHWGYAESVLIYNDLAIVAPGGSRCIVALNKNTGQPVWNSSGFEAGAQYGSCYAFSHGGLPIIAAGTHAGIVGVDARNGRMLWMNPFSEGNTANCPTPIYADGYVFWANGYGKGGICLRLSGSGNQPSAAEAWRTRDMVCHHGGYIVHEGYIYGNHNGGWTCLDLTNGQKMWEDRAVGKGSVCFADGMLYLFSEKGGRAGLATCSPQGLEMRGEFSIDGSDASWAHPVVIGGRLYLRFERNLYCFNVSQ